MAVANSQQRALLDQWANATVHRPATQTWLGGHNASSLRIDSSALAAKGLHNALTRSAKRKRQAGAGVIPTSNLPPV